MIKKQQEHPDIGLSAYFAKLGKKRLIKKRKHKNTESRLMAATQPANEPTYLIWRKIED